VEAAAFCEQSFRPVFKENCRQDSSFGTTFWFQPQLQCHLHDVLTSSSLDFSTSLVLIFINPVKS
jgi:hypothetical protein